MFFEGCDSFGGEGEHCFLLCCDCCKFSGPYHSFHTQREKERRKKERKKEKTKHIKKAIKEASKNDDRTINLLNDNHSFGKSNFEFNEPKNINYNQDIVTFRKVKNETD